MERYVEEGNLQRSHYQDGQEGRNYCHYMDPDETNIDHSFVYLDPYLTTYKTSLVELLYKIGLL